MRGTCNTARHGGGGRRWPMSGQGNLVEVVRKEDGNWEMVAEVCEQHADVSLVLEVVVGGAMVDAEGREQRRCRCAD